MKNLFIIIFFGLILSLKTEAQTVTWQRAYGEPNIWESGYSIVQLPDEGYIAVGEENNIGLKAFALKLDKFGNLIWRKNYPGRYLSVILPCPNGNYLMGGEMLMEINIYGDTLWVKQFEGDGFMLADFGGFYNFGAKSITSTRVNPSLRKFDYLGNLQWERVYSFGIYDGTFSSMLIDNDNNLVLIGNYSDIAFIKDYPFIMKTDSLGNQIWFNGYNQDSMKYIYINQIQMNTEGEFVVGGSNSICYFMTFDSTGNLFKVKYFESSYVNPGTIPSMIKSFDNGFVFSGFYYIDPTYNIRILKTNNNQDVLWSILYGTGFGLINDSKCVRQTSDSGFIMIGKREINHIADFLIIKTDKNGFANPPVNILNNSEIVSNEFYLYQNFPNPFNPSTEIKFLLNKNSKVELKIYNLSGIEITKLISKFFNKGEYSIKFDPMSLHLSSGIYFYNLETENSSESKKMLYIR